MGADLNDIAQYLAGNLARLCGADRSHNFQPVGDRRLLRDNHRNVAHRFRRRARCGPFVRAACQHSAQNHTKEVENFDFANVVTHGVTTGDWALNVPLASSRLA